MITIALVTIFITSNSAFLKGLIICLQQLSTLRLLYIISLKHHIHYVTFFSDVMKFIVLLLLPSPLSSSDFYNYRPHSTLNPNKQI